jgi:nitrite reductase/ring-hydroxylating ferredoxin subunit
MKKTLYILLIFVFLASCSSDNNGNQNCNFLLNVSVATSINLNLPQYSQLQFVSNSVYIPNVGNGGVIVINTGSGFMAWDAADPNRTPSACSVLEIDGVEAVSNCQDENRYSLFTGQPLGNSELRCSLRNYPTQLNGSELFIGN